MTWHVIVTLPDGRPVVADFREPIVRDMRRYRNGRRDLAPRLAAWLDEHEQQSAACAAGQCEHD